LLVDKPCGLVVLAGIEKIVASFVIASASLRAVRRPCDCCSCCRRNFPIRIARRLFAAGLFADDRTNRTSDSLFVWSFVYVRLALGRSEDAFAEFPLQTSALASNTAGAAR